jgi:hypothetical protein
VPLSLLSALGPNSSCRLDLGLRLDCVRALVRGRLRDPLTGHLSGTVPSGCNTDSLALTHLTWGIGREMAADQDVLAVGRRVEMLDTNWIRRCHHGPRRRAKLPGPERGGGSSLNGPGIACYPYARVVPVQYPA